MSKERVVMSEAVSSIFVVIAPGWQKGRWSEAQLLEAIASEAVVIPVAEGERVVISAGRRGRQAMKATKEVA
jgi:hypothetical protein